MFQFDTQFDALKMFISVSFFSVDIKCKYLSSQLTKFWAYFLVTIDAIPSKQVCHYQA